MFGMYANTELLWIMVVADLGLCGYALFAAAQLAKGQTNNARISYMFMLGFGVIGALLNFYSGQSLSAIMSLLLLLSDSEATRSSQGKNSFKRCKQPPRDKIVQPGRRRFMAKCSSCGVEKPRRQPVLHRMRECDCGQCRNNRAEMPRLRRRCTPRVEILRRMREADTCPRHDGHADMRLLRVENEPGGKFCTGCERIYRGCRVRKPRHRRKVQSDPHSSAFWRVLTKR